MKTVRLHDMHANIIELTTILKVLGSKIKIQLTFDETVYKAVCDFQWANNLTADGIVEKDTWKALRHKMCVQHLSLTEEDIEEFSILNDVDLAAIKAVLQVESKGSGYLSSCRPLLLFDGHQFWRELNKRQFDPKKYVTTSSRNILHPTWVNKFDEGGEAEYDRLQSATLLINDVKAIEAAYCSASWGLFQIMGYHYKSLGFETVFDFVALMYKHERYHLEAFGNFLIKNNLLEYLQKKQWAKFAQGYNGAGYARNHYDTKLDKCYKENLV